MDVSSENCCCATAGAKISPHGLKTHTHTGESSVSPPPQFTPHAPKPRPLPAIFDLRLALSSFARRPSGRLGLPSTVPATRPSCPRQVPGGPEANASGVSMLQFEWLQRRRSTPHLRFCVRPKGGFWCRCCVPSEAEAGDMEEDRSNHQA